MDFQDPAPATFKPESSEVTMRHFKLLASVALTMGVLFLLACQESPVTPVGDSVPGFARGGGGGGGGGKPGSGGTGATLTIRDGGGDAVHSDGFEAYVDGEAKAQVAITDGDFHFKARTHRKGTRSITVWLGPDAGGMQVLDDEFFDFRVHLGLPCSAGTTQTHGRFLIESTVGQVHLAFDVPGLAGAPLSIVTEDEGDGAFTWTITPTGQGYLRVDNVPVATNNGLLDFPFLFTVTGESGCP